MSKPSRRPQREARKEAWKERKKAGEQRELAEFDGSGKWNRD